MVQASGAFPASSVPHCRVNSSSTNVAWLVSKVAVFLREFFAALFISDASARNSSLAVPSSLQALRIAPTVPRPRATPVVFNTRRRVTAGGGVATSVEEFVCFTTPIVPHRRRYECDGEGKLLGMAFPSENELLPVVRQIAEEFAYDVEQIKIHRAGAKSVVKIAVDSDTRPDLDGLEEFSRDLSVELDAAESRGDLDFGPGYNLEVTTPGIDFPITELRHVNRNLGRLARLPGGAYVRLLGVDDKNIAVIPAEGGGKGQKGQARKKVVPIVHIGELADIAGAVIEVEFSKMPPAHAELLGKTMAEYVSMADEADNKL